LILINAAGGNITVSLPAANALGAGFRTAYEFVRIDASANTVTLLAAGTDKFAINSTSSYAMSAGETLFSSSDGISKWYSLIDILGGVFAGIISATAVGGTGNAITGTLAGVSAYPSTLVAFTATSTNTGAVTINLSSLGVLSVLQDGIALSGGEIVAGAKYFGLVVGSSFNLIGSTAGPINVAPATAASHALQLSQAAAAYGPKPTGSAGVGQFLALSMPAGSITLPAGGTWAWFFIDLTNTAAAFGSAGVSAGGTVIFTGTVSCAGGFCWRIA
jgi:hypothetical protein